MSNINLFIEKINASRLNIGDMEKIIKSMCKNIKNAEEKKMFKEEAKEAIKRIYKNYFIS